MFTNRAFANNIKSSIQQQVNKNMKKLRPLHSALNIIGKANIFIFIGSNVSRQTSVFRFALVYGLDTHGSLVYEKFDLEFDTDDIRQSYPYLYKKYSSDSAVQYEILSCLLNHYSTTDLQHYFKNIDTMDTTTRAKATYRNFVYEMLPIHYYILTKHGDSSINLWAYMRNGEKLATQFNLHQSQLMKNFIQLKLSKPIEKAQTSSKKMVLTTKDIGLTTKESLLNNMFNQQKKSQNLDKKDQPSEQSQSTQSTTNESNILNSEKLKYGIVFLLSGLAAAGIKKYIPEIKQFIKKYKQKYNSKKHNSKQHNSKHKHKHRKSKNKFII
jgi:hypothetical protein